MKPFISLLKPKMISIFAGAILTGAMISPLHAQQSGLPINAAASVNGAIITNDMVEQGIKMAISQGQKDSPELRKAVVQKFIEVLLLSQQAEKDGLANSEKANTQLMLIRQNYLADLELSTFMANNPITDADVQAEYNKEVASLGQYFVCATPAGDISTTPLRHGAHCDQYQMPGNPSGTAL